MSTTVPRESAVDFSAPPGPFALLAAMSLDVETLSHEALLDAVGAVEQSMGWAAAVRSRLIAEYASRGIVDPRDEAENREMEWHRDELAAVCRTSPYEAGVRCETALALRDRLPATAAAVESGGLPWAQAVVLARESRGLEPEASGRVERAVLADPRAISVRQVARATRAAVERIRPTAVADEARRAWAGRSLMFWPVRDGLVGLHAELPVDAAALVAAALDPLALPTGHDDERTAEQRRADALVTLCAGGRPPAQVQLLVRTDLDAAGAYGLSDARIGGEPVGPAVARRITCDGTRSVHAVDRAGSIDPGPAEPVREAAQRVPGAALRRRLEMRDQGCRFPGCPVRATRCHAHHVRHWADGGPTIDANMVLVCSRHHHAVHEGGWRLAGPVNELVWTDRAGRRYEMPPGAAEVSPWATDPPGRPGAYD